MKLVGATILALTLSPFAFCQQPADAPVDYHVTEDAAHELYAVSALAHGHRHGYEEGFHIADQDVHMGRNARALGRSCKPCRPQGYRSDFGDKSLYERGFELGFRAGYDDSYNQREFRPTAEILSAQLADFQDQNLRDGYREGLASRAEISASHNIVQECRAKGSNGRYCDGYVLGLLMQRDLGQKLSADSSSPGGRR